ncbi:MAG: NAD(P)/FAD-dependent oxidoreductase, partial [Alphaproteobacteria bacterium]
MDCDFLIVGAGMAGASAGYELASRGRVILLERESQPGYHSTGRSAAMYIESYGNAPVRAITSAGRAFFEKPPAGFATAPLLSPRGVLLLARKDQLAKLEHEYAELSRESPNFRRLTKREALAFFPLVNPDYVEAGLLDPDAMDMDVHTIHQGFLKGLAARGGRGGCSAEGIAAERQGGRRQVTTPA